MILVTGAAGFIGSNLVRRLAEAGHEVVAVDRVASSPEDNVSGVAAETLDAGDSAALAELFDRYRPRVVVALAEALDVPLRNVVEHAAMRHGMLLDAAAAAGVERVCFASSIAVHMGMDGPFREEMPLPLASPIHIGAIKKAVEQVSLWHEAHGDMQIVAMRLANIYGPRYHSMMNLPSRALFAALGREMPAAGAALLDAYYRATADYCYVDDCCAGIALIAQAPALDHRCYNIGGGGSATEAQVLHAVELAMGRNAPADAAPERSPNHLDISRIADELGYRPAYDLNAGIAAYRGWLERNAR